MACLFCFNTLCEALGADHTIKEILPVVQQVPYFHICYSLISIKICKSYFYEIIFSELRL